MNGRKKFLKFTMETGEDEGCNGWLPTLDTSLKVDERNIVQYKYYEKPTSSRECLHANSAMNMNSKMQILSNDMVRGCLIPARV